MNRRGFSLIELMLALGITSVVVAGISIVILKQSQASVKQTQQRTMEETGRQALLEIAAAVRLAGAGIAPAAAFDFDRYACTSPGTASPGCNNNPGIENPPLTVTAASPGSRDKVDAPDELVVSYRDPTFVRNVTSLSPVNATGPYSVGLDKALTTTITQGRIAMLFCSGADPISYVAFTADAAPGDTSVTVRPVQISDGYYPTPPPNDNCFTTAAFALVERMRYFVANDADGVPALFRDRGRAGDPKMFLRGIEDLQFTFTIGPGTGPAPGGGANCGTGWVYGLCNQGLPIDPAVADPDWVNDGYDSPTRFTKRPANVRSVEITVVARSTQKSPDKAGDSVPALGNRPARAADQYSRAVFKLSEQVPNLLARAALMPGGGGS
jgi:prepilin-type N-terminal cleavage/methylation domain-containing protein